MPGVADSIRKTQIKQEHKTRQRDMEELIKLVKEDRLHEANGYQIEIIKLALELNGAIEEKTTSSALNSEAIEDAVERAMLRFIDKIPNVSTNNSPQPDGSITSRPEMRHVGLTNLTQTDDKMDVVDHGESIGASEVSSTNSAEKLARLKKLRDGQS